MPKTGFYPGSFDPVTFGHLDIIARAARLFDALVLGVGIHASKQALLAGGDRVTLLKAAVLPITAHTGLHISVITFDDLAVDAARRAKAGVIIRGLRDASDFDDEVQMAQMNGSLAPDIETVFFAASPATRMIASSLVKQIARMGGDVTPFIPSEAQAMVANATKKS
jgi:pantetheine-phosphate adenylyltransferase